MNFGEWLTEQMERRHITQAELSARSGLTPSAISRWMRGLRSPEPAYLRKVLQVLDIPEQEGFRAAGLLWEEKTTEKEDCVMIPLLSVRIVCGLPTELLDDYAIEQEAIPRSLLRLLLGSVPDNHLYLIRAKGDSMIGQGIADGDLLLFTPDQAVQSNQIGVVFIEGSGLCIKQVEYKGEFTFLKSANPNYDPIISKSEDIRVIGKVLLKMGSL